MGDSRGEEALLYVWDELAVLNEFGEVATGNRMDLASYTFGLLRLALVRPGEGDQWLAHDLMGSIADIADTTGNLIEAKTYTPFGTEELLFSATGGGYNRYSFTGHEYDPETNLHYAKARFYDPDLGTFASTDPVMGSHDTPPSLHRYMYAFHNPLMYTDPTGLITVDGALQAQGEEYLNAGEYGKAVGIGILRVLWLTFGAEDIGVIVDKHLNGDPSDLGWLDYVLAALDGIPVLGKLPKAAKALNRAVDLLKAGKSLHRLADVAGEISKTARIIEKEREAFFKIFKTSPEQKRLAAALDGTEDTVGASKRSMGMGSETPDLVHGSSKPKTPDSKVIKEQRSGPNGTQTSGHTKKPESNTPEGRATTKAEAVNAKDAASPQSQPQVRRQELAATGTDGAAPPIRRGGGGGNGGTGGGIRYVDSTPTDKMVSQELNMSCGAACARQVLRDNGLEFSESSIRELAKVNAQTGVSVDNLILALNKLDDSTNFNGGSVAPEAFEALNKRGPWIAMLKPNTGTHFVIVDGLDDAGRVMLRDPWGPKAPGQGQGLQGNVDLDDFMEYWRRTFN